MRNYILELIEAHNEMERLKIQFEVYKDLDPKDDDKMYKYLLHKLRDLKEEILERLNEILKLVGSVKRVLEIEKELICDVDLR